MADWRRPQALETRAEDKKLDQAARDAAALIKSSADPTFTLSRFLLLLADDCMTRSPGPIARRSR